MNLRPSKSKCQDVFNLITPQYLNLIQNFAKHWQEITGSELLLLSSEGEVMTHPNGKPFSGWRQIINQISAHKPTFLVYSQQGILATPLNYNGHTLGYLVARDARPRDASLLAWGAETLGSQLADAQALQHMTDELIAAWEQLELIYRVTQNLSLSSDFVATLESILREIQKVVKTEDGFILLQTPESWICVTGKLNDKITYDESLLNKLIRENQTIICNTQLACQVLWSQSPPFVKNLLATPLTIIDENAQAAIGLVNKLNKDFTAGDVKLLAALAQQVGTIIKSFLIHQKLIIQERLSKEIEIAAELQSTLLPAKEPPQVGGVSMAVSSVPASQVSSDFYDFITVDDRYLTLVIGDVSGRGIPVAMLTSVTRTLLRVEALRGEPPHEIIRQTNHVLQQDLSRVGSSITVFVATVDTFEGTLMYASAGHPPTLLYRAETREVEKLEANAAAIGTIEQQQIDSATIKLNSGDTLVFYTDGVTETESPNNDLFGLNRLIYIVKSRGNDAPESLQQFIQSEVINFNRHSSGRADATLLIVKMLPYSETAIPPNISTLIKTVDFLYPADIDYLSEISRQISTTCRELPRLPSGSRGDDFIYLVELAISEICTNIIKHAYGGKKGNISGQVTLLNNGVALDFYDQGDSFDPNTVPQPKADPHELNEGGYGLHIIRQIMDVVSYEAQPGRGNHWHLIKFLPPA
jgi:serine phosphatase RsbU (regulator of sigma subunit)/anti-sigma regulatory factor (Ser/Thr protein kinase)